MTFEGVLLILILLICLPFQVIKRSSTGINILDFKELSWEKPFFCKLSQPYTDFNKSFVICGIDPKEDLYITAVIYSYIKYEDDLMELFLAATLQYPDSIVLDIGSNIGPYTLAASSINHLVITVDPILRNHGHLFNSLVVSGFDHDVTQILNAVSDSYITMKSFQTHQNHPGSTKMQQIQEEAESAEELIHSVKFEDILDLVPVNTPAVMKMDIEGYEFKALGSFLSSEVKKRFIPYILIETVGICNNRELCPHYKSEFLTGMQSSGYIPYLPKRASYEELFVMEGDDCPVYIFFVHELAKPVPILNKMQAKKHLVNFNN